MTLQTTSRFDKAFARLAVRDQRRVEDPRGWKVYDPNSVFAWHLLNVPLCDAKQ